MSYRTAHWHWHTVTTRTTLDSAHNKAIFKYLHRGFVKHHWQWHMYVQLFSCTSGDVQGIFHYDTAQERRTSERASNLKHNASVNYTSGNHWHHWRSLLIASVSLVHAIS